MVPTRRETTFEALLQVERPTGRDVGEGQGGDEGEEAEMARGRPIGGREVQPGGPRLLAKHPRTENGPAGGGKLGQ